jgi:sugar-phosphatase
LSGVSARGRGGDGEPAAGSVGPTHSATFAASIFDMDGLLIDSEILWHEAEIDILGGLGVPLDTGQCRTTKGMFVGEVTAHWYERYPWNGSSPDEVAATIVDRVIELVYAKGQLKPGAHAAIDLCVERGWAVAVASSSQYRLIHAALDHFGLLEQFALVHSAEDEDRGKPHPAVFLTAAARLGVVPRRCLVWEDAPAGVLAAKAATMACIAVPEAGEEHQSAFGIADLVVGSLVEVDGAALDAVARLHFGF